ncbi:MAG: c-type cytochrome [Acidobacteriota bacterium]
MTESKLYDLSILARRARRIADRLYTELSSSPESWDYGGIRETPMKRSVLTSTLFALFASVALTTAPALAQGKGPAAKVYTAQCAKCHSEDGKGIASLQPPDFTDAKWQASRTNKQLYNGIANGIGVMPGFKGALKPAQIQALVTSVRAFRKK